MGLLDTILSTIDAKKRSAKRGIMDMLDNPQQWAGMQANRIQEDRYGGAENAQAMKQYLSKQPYDPKALAAANDALRNAAINESLGAIFIGKGAKTWDKMKEADAMARLAKGEDAATVWKETGYGKAPWDKAARSEIDDSKSAIKKVPDEFGSDLSKNFSHIKAFNAYPDAKQISYSTDSKMTGGGSFEAGGWLDKIKFNPSRSNEFGGDKSITLHELQHYIQNKEGWQAGGSVENMTANAIQRKFDELMSAGLTRQQAAEEINKSGITKTGYDNYKRLAGEAEARLAQYRMNLTPEARAALYPYDPTYFKQATGVDIDKLITRGLLDQ